MTARGNEKPALGLVGIPTCLSIDVRHPEAGTRFPKSTMRPSPGIQEKIEKAQATDKAQPNSSLKCDGPICGLFSGGLRGLV